MDKNISSEFDRNFKHLVFFVSAVMLPYTGVNDERVVFYTSKSKSKDVQIHSLNNKQVDDDNKVDKHQTAFCIHYYLLQFYHLKFPFRL